MTIEVKTYKEYLADEAEASRNNVGDRCFVAGCTNPPPYYKVGDVRFWCGMCEEHAGMRDRYLDYVRTRLLQCGVRTRQWPESWQATYSSCKTGDNDA